LNNCLICSNLASGKCAGACNATLVNCTVVNNAPIGVYAAAPNLVHATNCIIYFNSFANTSAGIYSYCCTTPAVTGIGNFTNAPQLFADGIHLTSASPCIGAGTNVTSGTDIFGNAWANPPSVGCTEFNPAPLVTNPKLQLTGDPVGFTVGGVAIVGQPALVVWWLKDGVPLQDNGHFSFTQTTNLVATGVNFSDAGSYQLVVSNAVGVVTSAVAQLVVHCVDVADTNPIAPYLTWATAATNIQDAIAASVAGDVVLVTNGVYASGGKTMDGVITNRVSVDKAIIVQGVNGPSVTVIQGAWDPVSTNGPGAIRCSWLTNGTVLNGFTLQNGATLATGDFYSGGPLESGGGVWCTSTNGVVSDCVLSNNVAIYGGGMAYGTLNNSLVIGNLAPNGGGAYHATLNNCTLVHNYCETPVVGLKGYGGGTYDCVVRNSIVVNNYDGWPDIYGIDNYYYDPGYLPSYSFSCTYPLPSGTGNLNGNSASPQFVDLFHIATTSPCRAAGSSLYTSETDLDGEPWANPPSMGCDEVVVSNLVGPLSVNLLASQTNLLVSAPDLWIPPHAGFFQGIITGRVTSDAWSFGDGPIITNSGTSPSHYWTNAGDYAVTFTAYNNDNPGGVSAATVVHVLLPNVPRLQPPVLATNGFQFQFAGQSNANYTIQYATNLAPPVTWQTLQTIYWNLYNVIQVSDPATNTARFYRVLAQ